MEKYVVFGEIVDENELREIREEIKELTKPQPKEISLEERLEQTEQLLQATTMAFTEFIFSQTMGKQHDDN